MLKNVLVQVRGANDATTHRQVLSLGATFNHSSMRSDSLQAVSPA